MWKISELKSSRIRALLKKDRLLIALLSGILLLVVTWPAGEEQEEAGQTGYGADAAADTAGSAGGSGASAAYAADLERRLEEVLSQTEGGGAHGSDGHAPVYGGEGGGEGPGERERVRGGDRQPGRHQDDRKEPVREQHRLRGGGKAQPGTGGPMSRRN